MKFVRYDSGSGPKTGVVTADEIIDLEAAGCPVTSMMDIIGGGDRALKAVAKAIDGAKPHHALDKVRLLAPVERPGKYLAIGMNYKKHALEAQKLGMVLSAKQTWFNKQTSCIAGPYDDIDPGVSEKLDYEVELGVVIGNPAKHVRRGHAAEHIFGYFVANDVTARDWQFHSPTFTVGKSFDTHGPIGPWIVTADEIGDPHDLDLRCFVNGELRQSSNTSELIHDIFDQIEYLSTAFTLESGDLIATGTPEGVAVAMDPPVFLKPGDVVRCEIEKVGAIENRIVAPRAQALRYKGNPT